MTNHLLKSILLGILTSCFIIKSTAQTNNLIVESKDTALIVIRATVTPMLSGEMERGMDQLYSFNLLVKRSGSYHFPMIWIEGQSYSLVLGNLKDEKPIHDRDDQIALNVMVKPYDQPEQNILLPQDQKSQYAIGVIAAIDGEETFYIPIFSVTPLPKVINE